MDKCITLKINKIALTVHEAESDLIRIKHKLQNALEIFVLRLKKSPLWEGEDLERLIFDSLELEPLSVGELFSEQGAERLADQLYQKIVGGR